MTAQQTGAVAGPVLVIGAGLIGTSIALALVRAGVEVHLRDVDPEQLATAIARGAGSAAPVDAPTLVAVAVPPRFAADVLAAASQEFPTSTITDVTSVKGPVLKRALARGADPARLVGGHPMAGREVSGAAGARKDLFDDRLWILTSTDETGVAHQGRARQLATTCGAVPVLMSAAEHDQAVALVSHTPQVLSSALAAQLLPAHEQSIAVAGQGLRDMTRIAASDSGLWVDILTQNAGPVSVVLTGVIHELQEVLHALQELANGDIDHDEIIDATLKAGAKGRSRIPGKHGNPDLDFAEVAVMVEDKPGELARLFVAAGEARINLEDVRIEHVLGRPSGLVELSVRPETAEPLVAALTARGFDVRGQA
ncbi:MAG: prephenate dehydrogenase [Candidatus Nanopelagicales bacterium]|nr:prephenate dehydrogenase [Candidatus Nanopelagicales bacterium]